MASSFRPRISYDAMGRSRLRAEKGRLARARSYGTGCRIILGREMELPRNVSVLEQGPANRGRLPSSLYHLGLGLPARVRRMEGRNNVRAQGARQRLTPREENVSKSWWNHVIALHRGEGELNNEGPRSPAGLKQDPADRASSASTGGDVFGAPGVERIAPGLRVPGQTRGWIMPCQARGRVLPSSAETPAVSNVCLLH